MPNDTEQLTQNIAKVKTDINQLRDEIRVRLHLGAMDARDAFHTIEHEIDRIGVGVSRVSEQALKNAQARLKELSAAFRAPPPTKKP
jgi:hypothetical protein